MRQSTKKTKSISPRPNHHKSMTLLTDTKQSPKKKHHLSFMNAAQTERLITRLTDPSQAKNQDYTNNLKKKEQELQMKCDRLYATLDLFKLMNSNNMSVRCLQHNNALTLYCLTERKILCVHCTYGEMRHRTHKVLPLRDSGTYIQQDNQELNKIIKEDFRLLEESVKSCKQNVSLLSSGLNQMLKKMEEQYLEKRKMLEIRYEAAVKQVKDQFQGLITKSTAIEKKIQQFKFKIYECLSRVGLNKNVESTLSDIPVLKQIMCSAFTQLTKFQLKSITPRQIHRLRAPDDL